MRITHILFIILLLYNGSQAKHDKDNKNDDGDNKKSTVTIIEQRPVDRKVIIVQHPEQRESGEKGHPGRERIIVQENPRHHEENERKIYISDDDNKIIIEYYRQEESHHRHHKHHRMRPEWRQELVVGRMVPRCVITYGVPIEIEEKLPPLPNHYIRFMIGTSLFVKDSRTNVIVDAHFNKDF